MVGSSTVWAPRGGRGWAPATVTGLGKNRGDNTVVHLSFERGGQGTRYAAELYWRKAALKGKDKPEPRQAASILDIGTLAEIEAFGERDEE